MKTKIILPKSSKLSSKKSLNLYFFTEHIKSAILTKNIWTDAKETTLLFVEGTDAKETTLEYKKGISNKKTLILVKNSTENWLKIQNGRCFLCLKVAVVCQIGDGCWRRNVLLTTIRY